MKIIRDAEWRRLKAVEYAHGQLGAKLDEARGALARVKAERDALELQRADLRDDRRALVAAFEVERATHLGVAGEQQRTIDRQSKLLERLAERTVRAEDVGSTLDDDAAAIENRAARRQFEPL